MNYLYVTNEMHLLEILSPKSTSIIVFVSVLYVYDKFYRLIAYTSHNYIRSIHAVACHYNKLHLQFVSS